MVILTYLEISLWWRRVSDWKWACQRLNLNLEPLLYKSCICHCNSSPACRYLYLSFIIRVYSPPHIQSPPCMINLYLSDSFIVFQNWNYLYHLKCHSTLTLGSTPSKLSLCLSMRVKLHNQTKSTGFESWGCEMRRRISYNWRVVEWHPYGGSKRAIESTIYQPKWLIGYTSTGWVTPLQIQCYGFHTNCEYFLQPLGMCVKCILIPRSCGGLWQHASLFYNVIWFEEALSVVKEYIG